MTQPLQQTHISKQRNVLRSKQYKVLQKIYINKLYEYPIDIDAVNANWSMKEEKNMESQSSNSA